MIYILSIIIILMAGFFLAPAAFKALIFGVPFIKTLKLGNGSIFHDINFLIDPLSGFFILIILIMGLLGLIYSKGYLKPYIEKGKSVTSHYIFFVGLILSMIGVVSCQNAFFFLIIWEIMSLTSFFLFIFENDK